MLLPALLLPILAASAPADTKPITVTGRAWAPFISPMGEPFRTRTTTEDTFVKWFRQADRNGDSILTTDEMRADADRFFSSLDVNHDGEIDPEELIRYEWEVAPEIQVNMRRMRAPGEPRPKRANRDEIDMDGSGPTLGPGRGGRRMMPDYGPQGAARYALLNIPEPVAAADADFNRAITGDEFRQAAAQRFQLLDSSRAGRVSFAQLQAMLPKPSTAKVKRSPDEKDMRIGNPLPPDSKAD
jgi:Ca2+-binding EF-hand superfamily protein